MTPDIDRFYRTLACETPDAIIYADAEGRIAFWNKGAERIFGFSTDEAIGKSLEIIIPETLRKRHGLGFARTVRTGKTRYGDGDVLAVPAQLAGCTDVVLCTPANAAGHCDPVILYTARLCGVGRVFKLGGAQAIAAMAYGTTSVPRCDKLFGPGNAWVTEAKRQVANDAEGAAIDLPAGPSEVLVIADAGADAEFVAADLLSQAEHGSGGDAQRIVQVEAGVRHTQLVVAVSDSGQWRDRQSSGIDRGRGLLIMRRLMERVDIDRTRQGTTVRLEVDLSLQPT